VAFTRSGPAGLFPLVAISMQYNLDEHTAAPLGDFDGAPCPRAQRVISAASSRAVTDRLSVEDRHPLRPARLQLNPIIDDPQRIALRKLPQESAVAIRKHSLANDSIPNLSVLRNR